MQGKGREEDMMVLFLAPAAFDVFTGKELGLPVQIGIFPFGLEQLANPAQRAQAQDHNSLVQSTNENGTRPRGVASPYIYEHCG
jgi:hypothetical protein